VQASLTYAQRANHLTITGLAQWLNAPHDAPSKDALLTALIQDMLRSQRDFLKQKIDVSHSFQGAPLPMQTVFADIKTEIDVDRKRYQIINALLALEDGPQNLMALKDVDRKSYQIINALLALENGPQNLTALKVGFLTLQGLSMEDLGGEDLEDEDAVSQIDADAITAQVNTRLAQYFLGSSPKMLKATRGILFDMHRHACQVQARTAAPGEFVMDDDAKREPRQADLKPLKVHKQVDGYA
jgi:hypothetical protein